MQVHKIRWQNFGNNCFFSQVQHFATDFNKMTLSSYFKESMSYDGKKMCCGKHAKLNVYSTTWHND